MGGISNVFKGIASAVGLGNLNSGTTIAQDPAATKAATASANLQADLSNQNTPTIQSGGQVSSTSDTLASRRRKTTTGVASSLGIGS